MVEIPEIEDGLHPMCPHFGLLEEDGESRFCSLKRKAKDAEPRAFCRACGLSSSLFAEASVRPTVRHFLAQSLPFATCPRPGCRNWGANVFEQWGTAYRGESAHKAIAWSAAPGSRWASPRRCRRGCGRRRAWFAVRWR